MSTPTARLGSAAVPLTDLGLMRDAVAAQIAQGFERVLDSCGFIGGPEVSDFENAFAAYSGRRHCVGVANGTDAIELGLRALGIGPGDEILIPANTFVATAEAVQRAGARPVVCDIDPETLLIDVNAAERALTPEVRAIVPVHLYGQIAPMGAVQELARRH